MAVFRSTSRSRQRVAGSRSGGNEYRPAGNTRGVWTNVVCGGGEELRETGGQTASAAGGGNAALLRGVADAAGVRPQFHVGGPGRVAARRHRDAVVRLAVPAEWRP